MNFCKKGATKMNNVINFNKGSIPNDLMSFREISEKYKLKYGFLYKWSVLEKAIRTYDRGGIVISENDLLEFLDRRGKKWQAS